MYDQIAAYIEKYLSPFLCGFRKGYRTEHCLMVMLERWKKALDKGKNAGVYLQTSLNVLIAYIMNYWLQN